MVKNWIILGDEAFVGSDSEDDNPIKEVQRQMKIYANLIQDYKPENVYQIKEPVFFPRFIKTLLFQQPDPIMCVSHSIGTTSMAKSLYDICSEEELTVLKKMPLFFDDTPDMEFNDLIKRILPVIMENQIRWLIIKSSERFVKENEQELMRLANDFQLKVLTISIE